MRDGGAGAAMADAIADLDESRQSPPVLVLGTPDRYIPQAKPAQIHAELGPRRRRHRRVGDEDAARSTRPAVGAVTATLTTDFRRATGRPGRARLLPRRGRARRAAAHGGQGPPGRAGRGRDRRRHRLRLRRRIEPAGVEPAQQGRGVRGARAGPARVPVHGPPARLRVPALEHRRQHRGPGRHADVPARGPELRAQPVAPVSARGQRDVDARRLHGRQRRHADRARAAIGSAAAPTTARATPSPTPWGGALSGKEEHK